MNKIQEVKDRADIVKVAEYFSINLNRANKACCPFHKEKTASFSISSTKQIYKCFGCNKGGDVISLVSELLNINQYEAAKQINDIFNLGIDFGMKANKFEIEKYQKKRQLEIEFKKWIDWAYDVLTTYYKLLRNYIQTIDDFEDARLIEACQNISRIESHIDYLLNADDKEKLIFYKRKREEVTRIERRLRGKVA